MVSYPGVIPGNATVGGSLAVAGSSTLSQPVTVDGFQIPQGEFGPQDHGLECWTHDPYAASSSAAAVNGRMYVVKLPVRRAVTVSTLWWVIGTVGATPTAGQNEVGLFSSAGTRLAATNVDASISSAGAFPTLITAQALIPGSFVWGGFVFNAGTPPTLMRGSSFESSPSLNLGATVRRAAVAGNGLTALPASFSPAALSTSNCLTFFAGLSV